MHCLQLAGKWSVCSPWHALVCSCVGLPCGRLREVGTDDINTSLWPVPDVFFEEGSFLTPYVLARWRHRHGTAVVVVYNFSVFFACTIFPVV